MNIDMLNQRNNRFKQILDSYGISETLAKQKLYNISAIFIESLKKTIVDVFKQNDLRDDQKEMIEEALLLILLKDEDITVHNDQDAFKLAYLLNLYLYNLKVNSVDNLVKYLRSLNGKTNWDDLKTNITIQISTLNTQEGNKNVIKIVMMFYLHYAIRFIEVLKENNGLTDYQWKCLNDSFTINSSEEVINSFLKSLNSKELNSLYETFINLTTPPVPESERVLNTIRNRVNELL